MKVHQTKVYGQMEHLVQSHTKRLFLGWVSSTSQPEGKSRNLGNTLFVGICTRPTYNDPNVYYIPLLQGVGYSALTMVFLENVYYIIIVAWTLYYIINTFFSLGSGLPWSDCERGG